MAESVKNHVMDEKIGIDKKVIAVAKGKRIAEKRARGISGSVSTKVVGRPSLTGPSQVSPGIKARVPETLKLALDQEAKRQGRTPSALIREALEDYLCGK